MTLEELLLEKLFLWIWISIEEELFPEKFLSEECWTPLGLMLNELFLDS